VNSGSPAGAGSLERGDLGHFARIKLG
jgi:hypothetical protein